jgi:hypothetical protein
MEQRFKKQTGELEEQMEQRFKKQSGELEEQMEQRFKKQTGEFEELKSSVAAKIEQGNRETKIAFENLRHDLAIFDEVSSPGSTITLARRVTSLEGRVKNLEKTR